MSNELIDASGAGGRWMSALKSVLAGLADDKSWHVEHEERDVTDLGELREILTGREVLEAEVSGVDLDQGFTITFQGDRENGIPADHLLIWPVEENGIARLHIRLARTKWTRVSDRPSSPRASADS